jgi:hypothetical protein
VRHHQVSIHTTGSPRRQDKGSLRTLIYSIVYARPNAHGLYTFKIKMS